MHLSPEFGLTVRIIEEDGFEIGDRVEMLVASDSPEAIAESMGQGTIGYAQSYARFRPDILLVLGDRFEMHAAVVAALPFNIPVAHIHGGELTEGAIDDALRHSITKMSHLHFVSTEEYRDRVVQMGEEPWRVVVSGAPSLDNLRSVEFLDSQALESKFGLDLKTPPLLVTYHPVTLEYEDAGSQVKELLAALDDCGMPVVFTQTNADTGGRAVGELIQEFVASHPQARMADNMGTQGYFSLMSLASAMIGNSSSGIIEAPSFRLPVVNIGARQHGRVRAANVIDVGYSREEVLAGIQKSQDQGFRQSLEDMENPYFQGNAAEEIAKRLLSVDLDRKLIRKSFNNQSSGTVAVQAW
jgi:UDP-hydrolysing UDP-N-acetyl-D-glucosamine 2-epimerase